MSNEYPQRICDYIKGERKIHYQKASIYNRKSVKHKH